MLFTPTFTAPVVAFAGTVATICVLLQVTIVPETPLKLTEEFAPFVAWKPEPLTVT
jgi:hypothetical protein